MSQNYAQKGIYLDLHIRDDVVCVNMYGLNYPECKRKMNL